MFARGGPMFFFFNDTATTEIYTLSLHDALPISQAVRGGVLALAAEQVGGAQRCLDMARSEEHTSELQSRFDLVCSLLLEKKKFAAVQMIDVHLPTTDGSEIVLTRYTQPEPELQLLINQLKLTLPSFFFNDTATTEIYTLSLHDALPI